MAIMRAPANAARIFLMTSTPLLRGMLRLPEREQPVLGGEFESLHTAELAQARLAGHVQNQVTVAHPGTTAAEAHVVETGKGLLHACRLLERGPEEFPECHADADQDEGGNEANAGKMHDGDTGSADYGDLAATRQRAQADQRTDECGDRQQIEGERGQAQQREPHRPEGGITAAADVLLLTDEGDQRPECEQHGGRQQHRAQNGAHDVTIEDAHNSIIRFESPDPKMIGRYGNCYSAGDELIKKLRAGRLLQARPES